jgi:hypothetical protein
MTGMTPNQASPRRRFTSGPLITATPTLAGTTMANMTAITLKNSSFSVL